MAGYFRLQVVSLRAMLFDGDVKSVNLTGDEGEYELLPYHYPLMGALPVGEVKISGFKSIFIKQGVVLFNDNVCTMIVEEVEGSEVKGTSWSGLTVLKQPENTD